MSLPKKKKGKNMKQIKKIFRDSVVYYSDESTGITVAVCDDVGGVLIDIALHLEGLLGFFPPVKIKPYSDHKISVKVVCQPEDEWNEEYGRRLAFNKLYHRQFKSILNNVLANCAKRILNADEIICGIMKIPSTKDMLHFYEEHLEYMNEVCFGEPEDFTGQ
jgi:hypothetical protein